MSDKKWVQQWNSWIAPTRTTGVWRVREGGHLVRARVIDPTTGKQKQIRKVLPDADEVTAHKWLAEEIVRVRSGIVLSAPTPTRFADYVTSLVERKVNLKEIGSVKSRERWGYTLEHLISGTRGKSGKQSQGLGEMFIDKINPTHIEGWRGQIAERVGAGDYSPNTANGWLSILRVVMKAAKRELSLPTLATEGVRDFDVSEHETFTPEQPNSLLPDEVPLFLNGVLDLYPQFYAMTALGLVTGLRPSSLRPLRRRGDEVDVLWDDRRLLVRRSQTLGDDVMRTTKQKRRYAIDLPKDVIDLLQWHVDTQLTAPNMAASDLLFPSTTGGYRCPTVLNEPFADVCEHIKLGKRLTQKGLRRTFNDLARAAQVDALVTRSISGHATQKMQDLYSTVNSDEQRSSIAKVFDLATRKRVA